MKCLWLHSSVINCSDPPKFGKFGKSCPTGFRNYTCVCVCFYTVEPETENFSSASRGQHWGLDNTSLTLFALLPPHPLQLAIHPVGCAHSTPDLPSSSFFSDSFAPPALHCAGLERSKGAERGTRREDLLNRGETDRGEGPWLLSLPCWRPGLFCRPCAWFWLKWWVAQKSSKLDRGSRVQGVRALGKGSVGYGYLQVIL